MITLDASVLIAWSDTGDASHQRAVDLIDEHEWDEFATNAVALSELLVRPHRRGRTEGVTALLAALGVRVLPITSDDAAGVAALRAELGLRAPDATVLHTAVSSADALATFDKRLASAAKRLDVTVITDAPEESPDWSPPWCSAE
ncbi:PIN domain-containing protein [Curtobacterium sp. VKM Ac-2865]|uniref:type II toxin-antitoxin system VapC family toxin n=1 Tax=Curtobacterium sp. VKM Ac-2865 TaxID=2783817 RepID=UPI00188B36D3|nr:PIN domain-containing protein [Curtobacterium sp. VKM Ac-2865]MBF4581975.1 PIN domain-containing protein [Curtobacterium sp. VKM Ac-2865]